MVLLNVLIKPIWIFGIDRAIQNHTGYASYGLYAALLNLSIVFNILLDLGITNYNNKTLAGEPHLFSRHFPNMLFAKGFLALVYTVFLIVLALVLNYNDYAIQLLVGIILIQFLNSLLLFIRSNFSAHHFFKLDSFFSILDKILMLAFCGFFLWQEQYKNQFTIQYFVLAQIIAYALSVLLAFIIAILYFKKPNWAGIRKENILKILKWSMPYAVLILFMSVYMRADAVLLERLLPNTGAYYNGIYISAYRLLDALNMFGFLFAGMLLPMFSRLHSQQNKLAPLVQTAMNLLFPIAIMVAMHGIFYKQEIMNLLYSHNNAEGSLVYSLLMFCFPAYCIMNIYSTLLTANNQVKLLIKITLLISVLSLLLNFIIIPNFKVIGVAWVAIVIHWLAALAYIFFSVKKSDLIFQYKWMLQFLTLAVLFYLLNYLIHYYQIGLLISIFINALAMVLFVFILKIWKWKELTKYIKEMFVRD